MTFKEKLEQEILEKIKKLDGDGTTGMSLDNLFMIIRPAPSWESLKGAPLGTNARYYYKIMFQKVCTENKTIAAYVQGF